MLHFTCIDSKSLNFANNDFFCLKCKAEKNTFVLNNSSSKLTNVYSIEFQKSKGFENIMKSKIRTTSSINLSFKQQCEEFDKLRKVKISDQEEQMKFKPKKSTRGLNCLVVFEEYFSL